MRVRKYQKAGRAVRITSVGRIHGIGIAVRLVKPSCCALENLSSRGPSKAQRPAS